MGSRCAQHRGEAWAGGVTRSEKKSENFQAPDKSSRLRYNIAMKTRDTAASAKVVERVEKWAKRLGYAVGRSHIAETGTVYIPLSLEPSDESREPVDLTVRVSDHPQVYEPETGEQLSIAPGDLSIEAVIAALAARAGKAVPGFIAVNERRKAAAQRALEDRAAQRAAGTETLEKVELLLLGADVELLTHALHASPFACGKQHKALRARIRARLIELEQA